MKAARFSETTQKNANVTAYRHLTSPATELVPSVQNIIVFY